MRPSLANLGKGNPPHFCSLHSEVTNFFYRNFTELWIVVDSTVNLCHFEGDATIIRMALSKEIQEIHFYAWFVGQIIDFNRCTFAFLNITQNACTSNGKESVAVQK